MANAYSTIGADTSTDEEFTELARRATTEGELVRTARGEYYRMTDSSGAELWAQVDNDNQFVGLAPHFAGTARFRLRLTASIERATDSPLDGAFHAWVPDDDPGEEEAADPEGGAFPVIFDIPDGGAHEQLRLPALLDVQLAAFAHECTFHANEDAYLESQADEELKFAPESFVPAGMFGEESDEPPSAMALLSATVGDTRELANGWTGQRFRWARASLLGGELDIVADPEIVEGEPVAGGVVDGTFWLSGRLPATPRTDGAEASSRWSRWFRR
jgi:hypothetical protein